MSEFDHLIGQRVTATGRTIPNAGKVGTERDFTGELDSIGMKPIKVFMDGKRPRIRTVLCASVGRTPLVEVTSVLPQPSKFSRDW